MDCDQSDGRNYGGMMTVYSSFNPYAYQTYNVRERVSLNHSKSGFSGKPTTVVLGAHTPFSFTVWSSPANADEEVYWKYSVPRRWNGTTNLTLGCEAIIDTANTNKKFRFELAWATESPGEVLSVSVNTVYCEITTATDAQYQTYSITWDIDFDAVPADPIVTTDVLSGRIRRVAASSAEITGEVMLHGFYIQFTGQKYGSVI